MSRLFSRISLLALAAFACLASVSEAASPGKPAREPMVITSNHMEADKLGDRVTFTGSVMLKKEGMTLTADSMIVLYDEGTKDVREVEADGNVVVRKEGRVALANKALYYNREEKIVLTGDARIIENDNQLGGDKITLFIRDDRSIVEGGKVLLYQDTQQKAPGGQK
jgi:lipopolysaccharide export system protein LptA